MMTATGANDATTLHPTDRDEATTEDVLHSHGIHTPSTSAAHSIDAPSSHHLPLDTAHEHAAKHGAPGLQHRRRPRVAICTARYHNLSTPLSSHPGRIDICSNRETLIRNCQIKTDVVAYVHQKMRNLPSRYSPLR